MVEKEKLVEEAKNVWWGLKVKKLGQVSSCGQKRKKLVGEVSLGIDQRALNEVNEREN